MTEQYLQRNINNPEGSSTFTNSLLDPNVDLDISAVGTLVLIDTSVAAGTVTLPSAAESGAGAEITIVATNGATNDLNVAVIAGDTLTLGASLSTPLNADGATLICRSDGGTTWYAVAGS